MEMRVFSNVQEVIAPVRHDDSNSVVTDVFALNMNANKMVPFLISGVTLTGEQKVLLFVMVCAIFVSMVPLYKLLERYFGRLTFRKRKQICRIGQRFFGTLFVFGAIGSLLIFVYAPYMSKTSFDNMSVPYCCFVTWMVTGPPVAAVGVFGWACLVCLDFMPIRRGNS